MLKGIDLNISQLISFRSQVKATGETFRWLL